MRAELFMAIGVIVILGCPVSGCRVVSQKFVESKVHWPGKREAV